MPIEKVLAIVGNRYIALNLAADDVRRMIEGINRGEVQIQGSPYYESIRRLVDREVVFEPVSEPGPEAESAPGKGVMTPSET
jgi:hypothetical protein